MKKLLVGMAALSASAVSFAQLPAANPETRDSQGTSVKIYGVADLGIARYRTSTESKTAMHPGGSGSRLGFLAGEDLGQGLKVNARLEAGINLDTGTSSSTNGNASRVFSRQAYIELESQTLGALRLGRQEGPSYTFFPTFDPMLLPSMDAWGVLTTLGQPAPGIASGTGVSSGFLINPTARTENTVGYISRRWSGVQAKVSYSLNEGSTTVPNLLETSLDYASGPLLVGVLLVNASGTPGGGAIKATDSVREIAIGAKYEAGPVQPYVSFIRRDVTDPTRGAGGAVLNGKSETVKLIGAVIPVSARGKVRMTYGRYASGSVNRDASNYGIAYTFDVSRRLMLMAAYTHLSQGAAATWPVFQSPKPAAGSAVDGLIAGLNFRF
jgi:predicted porin